MRGDRGRRRLWHLGGGFCTAVLLGLTVNVEAHAADFDGPSFKKGLWRFQRTIELPIGKPSAHHIVQSDDMMRCVDPTIAMKGIFASPDVGGCRSSKAERRDNRYSFANRCDYMGPVRTDITVLNNEAYTEVNEVKVGAIRQVDTVIAHRVGDCRAED